MTLLFKLRIPMKDVCTANILLHFGKTKNFFVMQKFFCELNARWH